MFDGLKHTEETRRKMSESAKKSWALRKTSAETVSPVKISLKLHPRVYGLLEEMRIADERSTISQEIALLVLSYSERKTCAPVPVTETSCVMRDGNIIYPIWN